MALLSNEEYRLEHFHALLSPGRPGAVVGGLLRAGSLGERASRPPLQTPRKSLKLLYPWELGFGLEAYW